MKHRSLHYVSAWSFGKIRANRGYNVIFRSLEFRCALTLILLQCAYQIGNREGLVHVVDSEGA